MYTVENIKGHMAVNVSNINLNNDLKNVDTSGVKPDEVDGIEILVNMAKQGKIDPWNVDIVDVYDKYMIHLFQAKGQNLKITGRTILFAAILLKLKSNVLEGIDITDFQEQQQVDELEYSDDPLEYTEEDYIPTNNIISIDEVLQRRTSVRLNHNRVVTLRDLIRQLEFYEMLDKKQSLKNAHERAKRRIQNYAKLTPDDIINFAHDEYIDLGVQKLKANLEEILSRQEKIELNELTLLGMDKINAYISLLFLTEDSEYDIEQEEFYSDLYVVKRQPVSKEAQIEEEDIDNNIFDAVNNAKNVISEEENGAVEIKN